MEPVGMLWMSTLFALCIIEIFILPFIKATYPKRQPSSNS